MRRILEDSKYRSLTQEDLDNLQDGDYLEVSLVSPIKRSSYMLGYEYNETVIGGGASSIEYETEISTRVLEQTYLHNEILYDEGFKFRLTNRDGQLFLIQNGLEYVTQLIDDRETYPILERCLLQFTDNRGNTYYIGYDPSTYGTNPRNGTLGTTDLQTALNDERYQFRIEYVSSNAATTLGTYYIYNIGTGYYLTRNGKNYIWSQAVTSSTTPFMSYGYRKTKTFFGIHAENKDNPKTVKIQYEYKGGVEIYKFADGDLNKEECIWNIITLEVQPNNTSFINPHDNQTTPLPTGEVYFGEPVNEFWIDGHTETFESDELLYGHELDTQTFVIYQGSGNGDYYPLNHGYGISEISWDESVSEDVGNVWYILVKKRNT